MTRRSGTATTTSRKPLRDNGNTLVVHTYDWSRLTDEKRMVRATATTADKLQASVDRLAALAEG